MARWEKELKLNSGIKTDGYGEKIAYMKNLYEKNGALVKRQGLNTLYRFTSEELLPMRINGIFAYGDYLIVHAGSLLYKCSRDFSLVEPILMDTATLSDEKSSADSLNGLLFIKCNGAYIYDGEKLFCLDKWENIYVPKTMVGIKNTKVGVSGTEFEKPNLLTPKRINTLCGEKNEDRVSSFMLDSAVLKGSSAYVTVKIRLTHTPSEGEEESTLEKTSYIGVDSDGNECGEVATVKFHIKSYNSGNVYFVSEPIIDENGNEISIKTSDGTIYSYDKLTWSLQIVDKELRLNMELIPPYENEDNIEICFFSDMIPYPLDVKELSVITLRGGEGALAFCVENGSVYYTSKDIGCGYLPSNNKIIIGTQSTKIQRLISLQNGYIGVFTNEGFYKVGMVNEGNVMDAYKTGDMLSLASPESVAFLGNEPMMLSYDGAYAIKTVNGYFDNSLYLEKRSKNIDSLIASFTREEKENSHMSSVGDMLYLFIGDKALITGVEMRQRDNSYSILQNKWYLFDDTCARCSLASENSLYIGRENGSIATFSDIWQDREEMTLSYEKMELSTVLLSDRTAIVTPYLSLIENGDRASGDFFVKMGNVLLYSNKAQIDKESLFFKDNSLKIYEGQNVSLYQGDEKIYTGAILEIDIANNVLTLDFEGNDGEYELYISDEKIEYEIELMNDAFALKDQDGYLHIKELETIKVAKVKNIPISLIVNGIELSKSEKEKMVEQIKIKPTIESYGLLSVYLDGLRGRVGSEIKISKPFSLDSLSLDSFSFEKQFDRYYKAKVMLFTDCYTGLKLEACENGPFGIESIVIGWKGEK